MAEIWNTLRENIGLEEVMYFLGVLLAYLGSAAQFGHAIAQIVTGGILIVTALLLTFKGA